MMRQLSFLASACLVLCSEPAWAQAPAAGRAATPAANAAAQPGMRIGGERDGPVGLFVAPWQEPVEVLPEVPLFAALPRVVERDSSVLEEVVNRQFPAPASAAASRPGDGKQAAPGTAAKRVRGKKPDDEAPKINIMQHEKQ